MHPHSMYYYNGSEEILESECGQVHVHHVKMYLCDRGPQMTVYRDMAWIIVGVLYANSILLHSLATKKMGHCVSKNAVFIHTSS